MDIISFQLLDDEGPFETGNSKAFDDPKDAEKYVESILLKYPQRIYKTRLEIWNLPKNGTEDRRYLIEWEINHG